MPIVFLVFSLIYPEVYAADAGEDRDRLHADHHGAAPICSAIAARSRRCCETLQAIIDTGRFSLDIILIGAAAGIMVGIMSISGLAFGMTLQLIGLSGDNVFLLLLIIAVLAFVLGIGLPTVSVYILTATLLAPALVKLGVTPMAAHMFVMYNGMLSMITPPVAFAAYAAANIARTDGWTTGLDGLPGRLEHVHPAVPVRADAEPADGWPGASRSSGTSCACCSAFMSAQRGFSASRWRHCRSQCAGFTACLLRPSCCRQRPSPQRLM